MRALFVALLCAMASPAFAQIGSDPAFDARIAHPAFAAGQGPVVVIDEGHRNYHTGTGRYRAFADVLASDGYRVGAHEGAFDAASLAGVDLVVIASAVSSEVIATDPSTYTLASSAFAPDEIAALHDWVEGGGSLLVIVDYKPVPAMSADLAAAFGFALADGYAYDAQGSNAIHFTRAGGGVPAHPVTDGRSPSERVDAVQTFAGTAFPVPDGAAPLMVFGAGASIVLPAAPLPADTAPPADAPRRPIDGWAQGAVETVGQGRFALIGEAAMFTAERYPNGATFGMSDPRAADNKQLLVNLAHWLTGAL